MTSDQERVLAGLDELRVDVLQGLTHIAEGLAEEEARFRDIVARIGDGIVVLDHRRTIVFANPAAQRLFGRALADLIGGELGFPISTGMRSQIDIRRPDGSVVAAEVTVGHTDWEDEDIYLVCVREEAGHRTDAAALERYSLAFEGASDGLWDWNLISDEIWACPAFGRMLGNGSEEMVISSARWFERVHPDDLEALRSAIEAYLGRQSPVFRARYRVRNGEASYRWMLVRGTAVRDDWGEPVRFVGIQTDIDDVVRAIAP